MRMLPIQKQQTARNNKFLYLGINGMETKRKTRRINQRVYYQRKKYKLIDKSRSQPRQRKRGELTKLELKLGGYHMCQ